MDKYSYHTLTDFESHVMLSDSYIFLENGQKLISKQLVRKWFELNELHKNSLIKNKNKKVYFIFSEHFENFWEVRTLFDITDFVKTQVFVMKASLLAILFSILMYFVLWRFFTKLALRDLNQIIKFTKKLDINKNQSLYICAPKDDEIRIVAESLNKYNDKIRRQTENLKGFIVNIAHEFKTPLMVMNSDIDLYKAKLQKKWYSPEEEQEMLCKLKCKVRGLNETLETLFYVSRLEEGIILFRKEKINIKWYIEELCRELSNVYESQNIKVDLDIEEWVLLHIDETSFKIIIKNLVQNAFKYNKKGWTIRVHMCKDCFFVEDTGLWISKENLEKIWDNKFRGQENWDGIGLWLYLVKRLAELYGYEIKVESEEGEWSKFKIIF